MWKNDLNLPTITKFYSELIFILKGRSYLNWNTQNSVLDIISFIKKTPQNIPHPWLAVYFPGAWVAKKFDVKIHVR